jgi:hypothetical protein
MTADQEVSERIPVLKNGKGGLRGRPLSFQDQCGARRSGFAEHAGENRIDMFEVVFKVEQAVDFRFCKAR